MNQRGIWQLILMAREGDRPAVDELFGFSFRPSYLILSALTGDQQTSLDILAESYAHVFRHLDTLEYGEDFIIELSRFALDRVRALFPSDDFLKLKEKNRALADAFLQSLPQIHDFDTLPAMNLTARADEILSALHKLPAAQQVCTYLFYYGELAPETIADLLQTKPDVVCTALQQTRQTVLPQIDAVLKNSAAFRGADAESAILWALRHTQAFTPTPGETDAFHQSVLAQLVSDGLIEKSSAEEEPEPQDEIPMREIAPPKDNRLLQSIFSLHTLIIVLSVLVVAALLFGVWKLHEYNEQRRLNADGDPTRSTFSITSTSTTNAVIFSTDYSMPTEAPTEPVATTEAPTEPETTTELVTEPETTVTSTESTTPKPTTTTTTTTTRAYADFERTVTGSAVTITGYTGNKTDLEIPSAIEGKPVTAIGKKAFANCFTLQKVTIPASVTTIDSEAFSGCTALRSVSLPSSLKTLGAQAFSGCSALESAALPAALTDMGNAVFSDCTALQACTVAPNSKLKALGAGTFQNCSRLKYFSVPKSIKIIPTSCFLNCAALEGVSFGDDLTRIEASAFSGCRSLEKVVLPGKTAGIGTSAFSGCTGLTSISIPESVTQIGADAFKDCKRLSISCAPDSYAQRYAESAGIETVPEN